MNPFLTSQHSSPGYCKILFEILFLSIYLQKNLSYSRDMKYKILPHLHILLVIKLHPKMRDPILHRMGNRILKIFPKSRIEYNLKRQETSIILLNFYISYE